MSRRRGGEDNKQQRGWNKNSLAKVKNEPLINMFDEWFVFCDGEYSLIYFVPSSS
ncbi:hypothetical protein ABE272_07335 [Priestia aryabhattai]|uniref:hypothetical protein n=1 Tax=Priestia aryabhattai TaxID=412384 RepID=UPI003D2D9D37